MRYLHLLIPPVLWASYSYALAPRQRPAVPPSAASFYVPTLPGLVRDPTNPLHIFAGHIVSDPDAKPPPSKDVSAHLYFVLTKARRTADRERLIVWFNGGPGCSSFDGLMMETGPWRMDGTDSLKQKDGGWEEYANVLYLDQPPGTGFSYASTNKYVHELDEAAQNVIEFLKNWYEVFPEYKGMDTYLAGESFAGQYIPYIADALLKTTRISVALKGVAIGNGWIDPTTQYPAYIEFAVKERLLKKDSKEHIAAKKLVTQCETKMNETFPLPPHLGVCEGILDAGVAHLEETINGRKTCLNVYDIRLTDEYPACGMNWPPDLTYIKPYLQRDAVKSALHASAHQEAWVECKGTVSSNLSLRKSPAAIGLLPGLLEKIPVMLFSGDQDYICNHLGTERMIESMTWLGEKGYGLTTKPLPWKFNGTSVGEWTTARNLTYVKIFGASHMVGFDKPHVAHDMMLRFMGVDFSSVISGSAKIPSSVGNVTKPELSVGGALEGTDGKDGKVDAKPAPVVDQTAMWQSYYNAGSAALVLVLIALAIGIFFYVRSQRKLKGLPLSTQDRDAEESIPLSRNGYARVSEEEIAMVSQDKGKGRAVRVQSTSPGEPIFDVGDASDGEDGRKR